MFNSIKEWINVPFSYKPYITRNGAGTAIYDESVSSMCYPVSDVKIIVDYEGAEVTSTTTLYLDGLHPLKYNDVVIFEGFERRILRINTFYANGAPDIKVVYL